MKPPSLWYSVTAALSHLPGLEGSAGSEWWLPLWTGTGSPGPQPPGAWGPGIADFSNGCQCSLWTRWPVRPAPRDSLWFTPREGMDPETAQAHDPKGVGIEVEGCDIGEPQDLSVLLQSPGTRALTPLGPRRSSPTPLSMGLCPCLGKARAESDIMKPEVGVGLPLPLHAAFSDSTRLGLRDFPAPHPPHPSWVLPWKRGTPPTPKTALA